MNELLYLPLQHEKRCPVAWRLSKVATCTCVERYSKGGGHSAIPSGCCSWRALMQSTLHTSFPFQHFFFHWNYIINCVLIYIVKTLLKGWNIYWKQYQYKTWTMLSFPLFIELMSDAMGLFMKQFLHNTPRISSDMLNYN